MQIIRPLLLLPIFSSLAACDQSPIAGDANAAAASAPKYSAENPIIVELFQSQGCSSCPPANAALNKVAGRKGIIALNYSVTYWDRLGWKDIFGDPAFTQRQYDYRDALGTNNVYTPQIIINGGRAIVGNRPGELDRAITKTAAIAGKPQISKNANSIIIGKGYGKATIWMVRYDPRFLNVAVKAGENKGRTLPHKNIVRSVKNLGNWNGNAKKFHLPSSPSQTWKTAILVQKNRAGPIISAKIF